MPTRELNTQMHRWEAQTKGARPTSSKTLSYGGGVDGIGVTSGGAAKVYLVFYGSQWGTQGTDASGNVTFTGDPKAGAPRRPEAVQGPRHRRRALVGRHDAVLRRGARGQGRDVVPAGAAHVRYPTGGALAGVWYDNSVAVADATRPANQLGDEAVTRRQRTSATRRPRRNRDAQYVILSPTGTHPDGFNTRPAASARGTTTTATRTSASTSPYGDIAFTNMPYVMDSGTSCGAELRQRRRRRHRRRLTMVEGHEYAETITDQNPAGGWTNTTSRTYSGQENADKCAWISPGSAGGAGNVSTTTGSFAMQATWSNDTNRCDLSHATVG